MDAVFLKILNMSIAASWMILAVIIIRFLLKKFKVPKTICCVLWALVAFRLICPFSFESALSLIPSAEVITEETLFSPAPTIHTGVSIINETMNPVMSESLAPVSGASVNPLQVHMFIFSWVWVIGLVFMLGYALFSYLRLYKKVRTSIKLQKNVRICDTIDSPFILGIIKPGIFVPSNMDKQWLEAVLNHEMMHIKRHDHWWKPLGYLLLTIYWFNPLIWVAYILLCRDIEMACDERVVRDMDVQEKKDYSKALLSCSISRKRIAACPLAFGEVGVKERIKSVLNYKKPAVWIIVVSIIICAVIGVCFLTNPKEEMELASDAITEESEGQYIEGSMVPYEQNVDGTWTADGYTYKYRIVLIGRMNTAVTDSSFTVLTNNPDVTFEEVAWSLFSSNSEDWLDMKETRIVDMGTGSFGVDEPAKVEFHSLEEVFYEYETSSRIENPPFEHLLYAVLGNINTGVCEVLDSESIPTSYAEHEIPIDSISKIEVLNGNTGRKVTLKIEDSEFQKIIEAYYDLEYEPVENPREEDWRIGYLYRLSIYDQDNMVVQSITPYADSIQMNGEMYDTSMNRTSADLIAQLELLF